MKRTELERKERELKRAEKKLKTGEKGEARSVNDFIEGLFSLFLYDQEEVFNAKEDINILELFEEMKDELPEKQWENVIKKAVKKTKVKQRDKAIQELTEFLETI